MAVPRNERLRYSTPDSSIHVTGAQDLDGNAVEIAAPAEEDKVLRRFSLFSGNDDNLMLSTKLSTLHLPPNGGEGLWWLDSLNSSTKDIRHLCSIYHIHPLVCEDVASQETPEKLEVLGKYYFLCLKSFVRNDEGTRGGITITSQYFVVFGNGVISFSSGDARHSSQVLRRIRRLQPKLNMQLSADWICYAFIDELVDDIMSHVHSIRAEIDSIEISIMIARLADLQAILAQIHTCHKTISMYTSLLTDKVDVIRAFAKRRNRITSDTSQTESIVSWSEMGQYLNDVKDHVYTTLSELGSMEQSVQHSHSILLSQITTQQFDKERKHNKLMLRFNYIMFVFLLLCIIPNVFTVNVDLPGKNTHGLVPFFVITTGLFCIGSAGVLYGRRLKIY